MDKTGNRNTACNNLSSLLQCFVFFFFHFIIFLLFCCSLIPTVWAWNKRPVLINY